MREFCRRLGYRETRTDHYHYVKVLPDRSVSRTMVPFGADGDTVPAAMWLQVWKHQLKLASEEAFWRGLEGEEAGYSLSAEPEPGRPLPPHLHRFLRDVQHLSQEEIEASSREEAQELLNRYYARDLQDEP